MRTSTTLRLLAAILAEHERTLTSFEVVQCVHESLDTSDDEDLVAAAIRRAGGTYWRCSSATGPHLPEGPLNVNLAQHLAALAKVRGVAVEFTEVDGRIHVAVDGSDELTGGDAILGQVFAILCSSPTSQLLAYTYPLAELDRIRESLIWHAVVAARSFPPPQLKTLVAIASGDVDVERHCDAPDGGARFAVRDDELIRRPSRDGSRVNAILRSIDDPIVLFLGAGSSASARVPQGNRLRDISIGNLLGEGIEDPVGAFRTYLEGRPERLMVGEDEMTADQFAASLTLERVLREELHLLAGRPKAEAATVQAIAKFCEAALERNPLGRSSIQALAELLPRLVIVTLNFDQLIEVGMGAERQVFASTTEFASAPEVVTARLSDGQGALPILKIHGSIDDPETIIANIAQTEQGLPREVEITLDAIVGNCEHLTWVWIGCSMRDLDLRPWLAKVDATKVEEYWVDPLPPRSVADFASKYRSAQWARTAHQLLDRQVTESSDMFLDMLLKRARQLTGN